MPSIDRTLVILNFALLGACEHRAEISSQDNWYDEWLNHSTAEAHQEFHSEIKLASGEKSSVIVKSDSPITVGYFVRDGYEVTKDEGTIYMGTPGAPRMIGASPGSWKEFSPLEGSIEVLFENTSSIDTSLAVYTSTTKKQKK